MATTTKQSEGRAVDPSVLEELGKQAARLSETAGLSLAEAAAQTFKGAGLNAEQVRRAVEACNTEAVNRKFASLSGPNRITHIAGGPADPTHVIQLLKVAAAPQPVYIEALEYSAPPSSEMPVKVAMALDVGAPNIYELHDKLAAAHEELVQLREASGFMMEESLEVLKQAAHTAVLEGASLSELYSAWALISEPLAKVAARQLTDSLPWGTKVAGRRVAPTATVVGRFAEFAKVASRHHQETLALKRVEAELSKVATWLRKNRS